MEIHNDWWLVSQSKRKVTSFCETSWKINLGNASVKMLGKMFWKFWINCFRKSSISFYSFNRSTNIIFFFKIKINNKISHIAKDKRSIWMPICCNSQWIWLFELFIWEWTVKNRIDFQSRLLVFEVYQCKWKQSCEN